MTQSCWSIYFRRLARLKVHVRLANSTTQKAKTERFPRNESWRFYEIFSNRSFTLVPWKPPSFYHWDAPLSVKLPSTLNLRQPSMREQTILQFSFIVSVKFDTVDDFSWIKAFLILLINNCFIIWSARRFQCFGV